MRTPDLIGTVGNAWKVDIAAFLKRADVNPDQFAALGQWLLDSNRYHPFWSRWLITVVHLRDLPNQTRPPILHFPEATHEVMVWSLDPEHYQLHEAQLPPEGGWKMLEPVDQVVQFKVSSDEIALQITELAVQACTNGGLSPDSDHRRRWQEVITKTAMHFETSHGKTWH